MAYLKPQSPIKYKEDHIYPLTTIDQIIMDDGNRLSGVGVYLDRPEENEEGTATGINADSLGGKSADEYLTIEELDAQFIKANLEDAVFGEVAMNHADLADKANFADKATEADKAIEATRADNASKFENKTINELFAMMFEVEHPIGSLYLSMSENDDPNTKWNVFGITCGWELVKDRFLLGAGGTYTVDNIGGKTDYNLRANIGAANGNANIIAYNYDAATATQNANKNKQIYAVTGSSSASTVSSWNHSTYVVDKNSSSLTTYIIPPYIATNIWKRIS